MKYEESNRDTLGAVVWLWQSLRCHGQAVIRTTSHPEMKVGARDEDFNRDTLRVADSATATHTLCAVASRTPPQPHSRFPMLIHSPAQRRPNGSYPRHLRRMNTVD